MSTKDLHARMTDDKTVSSNLVGIQQFKLMVRRVCQKITESKLSPKSTTTATTVTTTTPTTATTTTIAAATTTSNAVDERVTDADRAATVAVVAKLAEMSMRGHHHADASPVAGDDRRLRSRSPPQPPTTTKDGLKRLFGATRTISEDKLRGGNGVGHANNGVASGYSSDSGTEKQIRRANPVAGADPRVRIRQDLRSRSKSYSRQADSKKAPKKILRQPCKYVFVRGLSGVSHPVPAR